MEVRPIGGLCNRLRVICSYLWKARQEGKTLTVYWFLHPACPSLFWDLFETPPADLMIRDGEIGGPELLTTCQVLTEVPVSEWQSLVADYLRPIPTIQTKIDRILDRLGEDFTAVHIRRTDHNANFEEDAAFVEFCLSSSVSDTHRIFAAADNPLSIVTLKKALRDRLVYAGSFSTNGIRLTTVADAVVDLWVAGYAARFKGTYWSSFSEWIEMIRSIRGLPVGDIAKIDAK